MCWEVTHSHMSASEPLQHGLRHRPRGLLKHACNQMAFGFGGWDSWVGGRLLLSPESGAGLGLCSVAIGSQTIEPWNLGTSLVHGGIPFWGVGVCSEVRTVAPFLACFPSRVLAAPRSVQACISLSVFVSFYDS